MSGTEARWLLPAAAAATGALAYAVRAPSCSWLAPSFHRGDPLRRSLALTFDDGPSESTPALLDVLSRYGVRATFFQCGANVRRLPAIAREVAAAGHEIENHTDTHPLLALKSPVYMEREIRDASDSILAETGIRPRYFRPPFGVRWFGLGWAQHRSGVMGVMWSSLGVDWRGSAGTVTERVMRGAGNGAIVCLHDGRELLPEPDIAVTLAAVRASLPRLIDQGYQFEKVSQISCKTI